MIYYITYWAGCRGCERVQHSHTEIAIVFQFSIEARAKQEKLQKITPRPLVFCVKILTHATKLWPTPWRWGAALIHADQRKPSAIVIFLRKTPFKRMKCFSSTIHPQGREMPPTGVYLRFCVFQHKNLQFQFLCTNFVLKFKIALCLIRWW